MSALFEACPELRATVPWVRLGDWPSPLEAHSVQGRTVWFKREDAGAPVYAGNKIRPLEMVFGAMKAAGRRRVWATGAYGSNLALATVLQAPRAGLDAGVILYPQPPSASARASLLATLSSGAELQLLRTIAALPAAALAQARRAPRDWVMPPGPANPRAALGHASAAIELAHQLSAEGVGAPGAIVVPAGSVCTAVGLVVGTALTQALGLSSADRLPEIHAVRVTPWPITSALRIARMAVQTAALLHERGGPRLALTMGSVLRRLHVIGGYIGAGYGRATEAGIEAMLTLVPRGLRLDTTYSAKSAAYLLDAVHRLPGPVVFWSTKSSLPLPAVDRAAVDRAPDHVKRWLARC